MSNDFSWHDESASVVVQHVDAIAVYFNPDGNVVIRQQVQFDEDDFIVIPRQYALLVANAIKALAEGGR